MEKKNTNMEMVNHVVGNNIGHVRGNYIFYRENKEGTEEFAKEAEKTRIESIQRLEKWLQEQGGQDKTMLKFMDELRASEWSTED